MDHRSASAPLVRDGPPAGGEVRSSRDATRALWLGAIGVGFGFLLMFMVLTPAAIIFGVRALRAMRVDPGLQGRSRAWAGMTLAVVAPLLWCGVFVAFLVDGIG